MTGRTFRHALFAVCCIGAVPLLASCFLGDPDYSLNPSTISRDGDSLLIAVCLDAHVTDVRVEARGYPVNWKEIFIATGDAEVRSGYVFSTDGSIPGLKASTATSPDFDSLDQFMVVLSDSHSASRVSSASFDASGTRVPTGSWLHSDGRVTEDPCPG